VTHLKNCDKGPFKASDNVKSETNKISKTFIPKGRYDYAVSLTDQPGTADTTGIDRQHANNLVEYLRGIEYINAIVLVKNYHNSRLDMEYQNMLKNLEMMLGREMWKHIIIVFTKVEGRVNNIKDHVEKFVTYLREIMNLTPEEAPISTICLSNFENFENPIKELINVCAPSKGKFVYSHLQSPLQSLQIELKKKKDCLEVTTDKLNEAKKYLSGLIKNIADSENRIKQLDNTFKCDFKSATNLEDPPTATEIFN